MNNDSLNLTTNPIELKFKQGALVVNGLDESFASQFPQMAWDKRILSYRAPGFAYRQLVMGMKKNNLTFVDQARQFYPTHFSFKKSISPRPYQQEALKAWQHSGGQGMVVLPTGAGKTILAVLAIQATGRPTLVHVPTIDLMHQWYETLRSFFDMEIGLLGGGYYEIAPITVATYDSALLHVENLGNRFGFLIFDECHHLPGPQTQFCAIASLAPFRLGLTATPDANPERLQLTFNLLGGAICFQTDIRDLEGKTLAPYDVVTLEVEMDPDEFQQYQEARKIYLEFVKQEGIDFSTPTGWQSFIFKASRSQKGQHAFQAYLQQKRLSQASRAKEEWIWEIIKKHPQERILVFTQDNEMAYRIGKKFLLPVLTHHTKVKERKNFLENFRKGVFNVLITSKVLNEGVDVPEASVAIVVSGSGTVREHVQRLGRILRATPGKSATLYELISAGTSEYFVNQRRKKHSAYEKTTSL